MPESLVTRRGKQVGSRQRARIPVRARLTSVDRRVWHVLLVVLSAGILLAGWWYASRFFEPYVLPGPGPVWDSFEAAVSRGIWADEILATLAHMFLAVAIVLAVGLPLGILIGRSWVLEDLTRVAMIFLQTVPTIVLIAVMLVFVGTNDTGVVAVTVASCFTYFTLNVIQGTKSIDHDLVEMARSYGAREVARLRSVYLPSVVPFFLAGARITLGVAWQVTLFSEYLMGTSGVGFQVSTAIKLLATADVFMWGMSVVGLTIAFEYGIFRPVERLLTKHARRG